MRLALIFGWLLIGPTLPCQQVPECIHDPDACSVGMCKVWESSRFVCEPETYAVMVFPSKCLVKIKVTSRTNMEMRMNEKGEPDKSTVRIYGSEVEFKPECGHVEIRKRNVNY